jgi:hypothetical protein
MRALKYMGDIRFNFNTWRFTMRVTKEFEMEQLDLAIRYYEEQLKRVFSINEEIVIIDTIRKLSSQLKELQCVQ